MDGQIDAAKADVAGSSSTLDVKIFLLSCRSLHLGVEHAMMRKLAQVATLHNKQTIKIRWRPSERNDAACHFFAGIPGAKFVSDEGAAEESRLAEARETEIVAANAFAEAKAEVKAKAKVDGAASSGGAKGSDA